MILLLTHLAFAEDPPAADPETTISTGLPAPTQAVVRSVYDGDTLTLDTGDKVRLRWVNTPELKPPEAYGADARDFTKGLVLGKQVQLLGSGARDGYGRLLAGVEVDGANLSVKLLEAGLGHLFVIPPDDTDLTALLAAQEKARQARRGIWADQRYQGSLHITSFHANADGDDRANVNGEYLRVCNVSAQPVDLTGFRIADISGNSWEMPTLILPVGHTVKIHSGIGTNVGDTAAQLEIFLGSRDPIWNNTEDRATIYDRFGRVVDAREHDTEKANP